MRFVDLFAGLGGFHLAATRVGGRCVFASELDAELRTLYAKNFSLAPHGDLRSSYKNVPEHDLLCAGFPCQPFSRAGRKLGFLCPESGDLFSFIVHILRQRRPRLFILENVPHLLGHDGGLTFRSMLERLRRLGYDVRHRIISPTEFGVPHSRDRLYIVGSLNSLQEFAWPESSAQRQELRTILRAGRTHETDIGLRRSEALSVWRRLLNALPRKTKLPPGPLWAAEFGASYPFERRSPKTYSPRYLHRFRGSFGRSLEGSNWERMAHLFPSYAARYEAFSPRMKKTIASSRFFYERHKRTLRPFLTSLAALSPSLQRLEWCWKTDSLYLDAGILQFRASGIRVRAPTAFPALVAFSSTHLPVVGWEQRFLSLSECAALQSLQGLHYLPSSRSAAVRAIGNAINVKVATRVLKALLQHESKRLSDSEEEMPSVLSVNSRASGGRCPNGLLLPTG